MRRLTRRSRHALTACLLDLVSATLKVLPKSWVSRLGERFGQVVSLITRRQSRLITTQMRLCLKNPPAPRLIWADLGRRLFELMDAERQISRVQIPEGCREVFDEAREDGRGILLATLHLGNWELMAAALVQAGYRFKSIASRPKNSPLYKRLSEQRRQLGVQIIRPGHGARDAVAELKSGGTVSIFIDQNTGERSRNINFFGQSAPTPTTFERLQKTTNAIPMMVWNYRNMEGGYTVEVTRLDEDDPLASATKHAETLIRRYPTQWIWMHRRWRQDINRTR